MVEIFSTDRTMSLGCFVNFKAAKGHGRTRLVAAVFNCNHVVIAHAQRHADIAVHVHRDVPIRDQARAENAALIVVSHLRNGNRRSIERQACADCTEFRILHVLWLRAQILCQQIGQRHKALKQELQMREALGGDRRRRAVKQAVKLLAGAEGKLYVAFFNAFLHPAAPVFEGDRGSGAPFHLKADRKRLFVGQERTGVGIQRTQILQRAENAEQIDVRHGFGVGRC